MKSTDNREQSKPDYKTAEAWHLYWVYSDPEFINDLGEQVFGTSEKTEDYLCKKYLISGADIHNFVISGVEDVPQHGAVFEVNNSRDSKTITMRFSWNITREEYEQAWELFKWYREKRLSLPRNSGKRKPPENTKLIYAIFKARQLTKPLTFKAIYRLYEDGQLPFYENGGNHAFKSEDSLERYYQKYQPRPPAN